MKKKLDLDDLKVESFTQELDDEELTQIESTGGGTYGPSCGATRSFNCYSICELNQDP